jgi:hypothetical protein
MIWATLESQKSVHLSVERSSSWRLTGVRLHRDSEQIVVPAKATIFSPLRRHPYTVAACIALGAVAAFLLIGYFTIDFPVEVSAAKIQSALEEAFPKASIVAGMEVNDRLCPFLSVDVAFVGDETKQLEMRDWLAKVETRP